MCKEWAEWKKITEKAETHISSVVVSNVISVWDSDGLRKYVGQERTYDSVLLFLFVCMFVGTLHRLLVTSHHRAAVATTESSGPVAWSEGQSTSRPTRLQGVFL